MSTEIRHGMVEVREEELLWLIARATPFDDDDRREFSERVSAIRQGRRVAGLSRRDPRTVEHVDGDVTNNDISNIRLADPKENER